MQNRTDTDNLDHNPAARESERSRLAGDVEAFLNSGGVIREVAIGERADPPKRPESNYGRGAI